MLLSFFSSNEKHLPSLYMRWFCLHKKNDSSAEKYLVKILEAEYDLQRQGKCGYLLPQMPPKINPAENNWLDDFLFYVHFKEVDFAAMEISCLDNLDEKYPIYRKLIPKVKEGLMEVRVTYLDKVRTFQLAEQAIAAYDDIQRKQANASALRLYDKVKVWLSSVELPESFSISHLDASHVIGDIICKTDLAKVEVPFGDIINYYFIRGQLQAEGAVFLLCYYQFKLYYDGVDNSIGSIVGNACVIGSAFSGLIQYVMNGMGQPVLGVMTSTILRLIPHAMQFCKNSATVCLKTMPFPKFRDFKDDFYEWETQLDGKGKTIEDIERDAQEALLEYSVSIDL